MNGWDWFLISVLILSTVVNFDQIGKPREPLKPETFVGILLLNAILVIAVVQS